MTTALLSINTSYICQRLATVRITIIICSAESEGTAEVKHDATAGKLWSTQYWTNVDNDLTLNYTNDAKASSDGIFLVANPTMSHLNIAKFLDNEDNKEVMSGVKLYNQGAAFSVIDVDGDLVSSSNITDADKFVAPSAAFFVEAAANNASNTLQVEYDNTMFGDQPDSLPRPRRLQPRQILL